MAKRKGIAARMSAFMQRTMPPIAACARRAASFAAMLFVCYFLIEFPSNQGFLVSYEAPMFFLVNMGSLALVFLPVYFLLQQTRMGMAFCMIASFLLGTAEHFVLSFRGSPIQPLDFLSLGTASEVASGYSLTPTGPIEVSAVVLIVSLVVLFWRVPKIRITKKMLVVNLALAVVAAGGMYALGTHHEIQNEYGSKVNAWDPRPDYVRFGYPFCTLVRFQQLTVPVPQGYSAEAADQIMADAQAADETVHVADKPTIIAVMNESFSDMSAYPSLKNSAAKLSLYSELLKDPGVIASGTAYASVYGGGTCDSEYEMLTGNAMANLCAGQRPYIQFPFDSPQESLASVLKEQGYATTAIHPADATNWNRDKVYPAMGFDRFIDINEFSGAERIKGFTSDRETYKKVLELLDEGSGAGGTGAAGSSADGVRDAAYTQPQFIFDLTIQNHGGYATGLIREDQWVDVKYGDGQTYDELSEYVSCVKQSEIALQWFLEELKKRDENVVVLFFGDHQPWFTEWLDDIGVEEKIEDKTAEQSALHFCVPYMIWSNYDSAATEAYRDERAKLANTDTSINYLGMMTMRAAGVKLSPYQAFLAQQQKSLPVTCVAGCQNPVGQWSRVSEKKSALHDYLICEYRQAFDNK